MPGNWIENVGEHLNKSQKRSKEKYSKLKKTKKLTYHYFIWKKIYFPSSKDLKISDLAGYAISNIMSYLSNTYGDFTYKTKWGCIPEGITVWRETSDD